MGIRILSTGCYVPETIVDYRRNTASREPIPAELATIFAGAQESRVCNPHETSTYMGTQAVRQAIGRAGVDPAAIDSIISYTVFADHETPKDVYGIAKEVGCTNAVLWTLDTACASFLSQLNCANALSNSGLKKMILVTSTNWVTRGISFGPWHAGQSAIKAGDGAGAVIVEAVKDGAGVIDIVERTSPSEFDFIKMDAAQVTGKQEPLVFSTSHRIIAKAIAILPETAEHLLARNSVSKEDIDWTITHQPGEAAITRWHEMLDIPIEKNLNTFSRYGNMSASNIPVTLDHYMYREPKLKRGDLILMFSAGAGIHGVAALIEL